MALIPVTLIGDEADAADTAAPVVAVVRSPAARWFRVTTVGFGSVEGEMSTCSKRRWRRAR